MARLENNTGHFLELQPIGYQFAEISDDQDLELLQVKITADNGKYQWSATGPAFCNWELALLAKWLRSLATRDGVAMPSFKGGYSGLKFEGNRDKDKVKLRAIISSGFLPSQLNAGKWYRRLFKKEVIIYFDVAATNVLKFASDLKEEVARFPLRREYRLTSIAS